MRNPLEAVPIAVALVTNSDERGERLQAALHASGVDVYLYSDPDPDLLSRIPSTGAAAIIVDLDGGGDREQALIDTFVRQDFLPVLFNDGSALGASGEAGDRELGDSIKHKLLALLGRDAPAQEWVAPADVAAQERDPGPGGEVPFNMHTRDPETRRPARQVWVLGASLGGPDAVKRFISRIPGEFPAAFILAQHISMECIPLLLDQIRRITALKVMSARRGHLLQHGQLVVAPVDRHLDFDDDGHVHLGPETVGESEAPPSIDAVMAAVAARFGDGAGAIVFSGIGNDGVLGARSILEQGGTLWAQAADSCIMSSMPDHVRNACPVGLNASPEELADRLIRRMTERTEPPFTLSDAAPWH